MQRREFIELVAATATLLLAATEMARKAQARVDETVRGDMRYRPLGTTGELVSVIGLGGHHIGRQKDEKDSLEIIRAAIDSSAETK